MIEQGLFKKYFVGRDGFYWWIGQIAEESSWVDNKRGIPADNNEQTPGFGERYKVRIMGHHTAVPSQLPDDHLPWATVMYPVTAGGGTAGTSETANLRQGMFVFGFFMDGEDGQQPVIMGVIGYNNYTAIMAEVPDAKFVPFTGLNAANGQNHATFSRKAEPGTGNMAPAPSPDAPKEDPDNPATTQTPPPKKGNTQKKGTENDKIINGTEAPTEVKDAASTVSAEETQKDNVVPKPSKCDPIPFAALQLNISNFVKDIEKTKKTLTDYRYAATRGVINLEDEILQKKEQVTKAIMSGIYWVLDEAQRYAANLQNTVFKELFSRLNPNELFAASTSLNGVIDIIICVIKKVFGALGAYIFDLVDDIIDKVINVTKCFIENFIAAILGTVNSLLNSLLSYLTDTVTGMISGVFDVALAGVDLITTGWDIIQDVLSLLSCNDDPECDAYNVSQWNILTGGKEDRASIDVFKGKVDRFTKKLSNISYDFTSGIDNVLNQMGNALQGQLADVFDDDTCNIGPILCGPPSIQLFGGTGAGFAANPVIGSNGSIIAVDIVSMGSGYRPNGNTYAQIVDACGNGSGGVINPIFGGPLDDLLGIGDGIGDGSIFDDNLTGTGRRGVLDPYWNGRRAELASGGAGGGVAGVVSPVFVTGSPVFTGLITGDRLNLGVLDGRVLRVGTGGAGGIGTTGIGVTASVPGTQPSNSFENNIPKSINQTWLQQSFPGNIPSARIGKQFFDNGFEDVSGRIDSSIPSTSGISSSEIPKNYSSIIRAAENGQEFDDLSGIGGTVIGADPTVGGGRTDFIDDGTVGITGFVIIDGGSGYLRGANGDLGGMNRTWATADQTKILKPDGTYLLPSSPGDFIVLDEGDSVELPVGTRVVTEPLENGTGGGEEIVGGVYHVMARPGQITAPEPETSSRDAGEYPADSDGKYPVITYLSTIFVQDPGVGYSASDEVILTPSNGAEATITVTELGAIESIRVIQKGEGFKVRPTAYIKTEGGIGALLAPQLGLNRIEKERLTEPGIADKVIQVEDVARGY